MNIRLLLLVSLAAASLLFRCGTDTGESVPGIGKYEKRACDTLARLRDDYNGLVLWRAMERARWLGNYIEATPDSVSPAVRAEVYQYLSLLHYERRAHLDSVTVYNTRVMEAMPAEPDPVLAARHLLALAVEKYALWEWLNMDMLCELGKQTLARAGPGEHPLMGELLVAQGYARSKYAEGWLLPEGQHRTYRQADSLLQAATRLFDRIGSPRVRQAREERILLNSKLRLTPLPQISALIDTLRFSSPPGQDPGYGYPERLLGHHYAWHERPDSVIQYYRRMLGRPPPFRHAYVQEARYQIAKASVALEAYGEAFDILRMDRMDAGCMLFDPDRSVATGNSSYISKNICVYHYISLAETHLKRYGKNGEPGDLDTAFAITQEVAKHYQDSYPSLRETGALNKLVEVGQSLLEVTLRCSVLKATQDPGPDTHSAVLLAMEQARSLLLLRDLMLGEQQKLAAGTLRILDAEISDIERKYVAGDFALPYGTLDSFRVLDRTYRNHAARVNSDVPLRGEIFIDNGEAELTRLQRKLTSTQALLEITEIDSRHHVLYIDRDTSILYALDAATTDSALVLVAYLEEPPASPTAATYARTASWLYREIFEPIRQQVARRPDLLIAPSPGLSRLPFSALTPPAGIPVKDFSDLSYLLDDHTVRYLFSWAVEERGRSRRSSYVAGSLRSVGVWTNPDLQNYLGDLGDGLVRRGTPNLSFHNKGTGLSASQFMEEAPRYDLVHLSAHAGGNPLKIYNNQLYLSGRDSISGLDLTKLTLSARLVVLAACSTADGYTKQGEGTFSLRRSFRLAGVPDVVCSLYDIPAVSTRTILETFYEHLFRGEPLESALSMAQRDCRRGRPSARYTHPRYWAGLIVG